MFSLARKLICLTIHSCSRFNPQWKLVISRFPNNCVSSAQIQVGGWRRTLLKESVWDVPLWSLLKRCPKVPLDWGRYEWHMRKGRHRRKKWSTEYQYSNSTERLTAAPEGWLKASFMLRTQKSQSRVNLNYVTNTNENNLNCHKNNYSLRRPGARYLWTDRFITIHLSVSASGISLPWTQHKLLKGYNLVFRSLFPVTIFIIYLRPLLLWDIMWHLLYSAVGKTTSKQTPNNRQTNAKQPPNYAT